MKNVFGNFFEFSKKALKDMFGGFEHFQKHP